MVPLWDFNATSPAQYGLDSSSALIAASGLVELSTYVSSSQKRDTYLSAAKSIIESVSNSFVFAPRDSDAVVKNGTSSFPATGIPLIYGVYSTLLYRTYIVYSNSIQYITRGSRCHCAGDYFFMDTLQKLDIVSSTAPGAVARFVW